MEHATLHYGPEYLDHLADQVGSDHAENAIALRQAARNWRADQQACQEAQADASRLQLRVNRITDVVREEAPCN